MAITVGCMSLVAERLWIAIPESPYFASSMALGVTAACILFGGLIAFLMVWVEFSVIQETSALTFMVAGTFKEIVTGEPCFPSFTAAAIFVPCECPCPHYSLQDCIDCILFSPCQPPLMPAIWPNISCLMVLQWLQSVGQTSQVSRAVTQLDILTVCSCLCGHLLRRQLWLHQCGGPGSLDMRRSSL